MNHWDALLARMAFVILTIWAIWITARMGIKPEEIGQAVKNFNASFGVSLPSSREREKVGNSPGPSLEKK